MNFLTDEQAERIGRMLRAYEAGEFYDSRSSSVSDPLPAIPAYVVKLANSLPALSGTTAGQSSGAHLYKMDSSGNLTDTSLTQTVWNFTSNTYAANTFILTVREPQSGLYCAVNCNCNGS